ncbi:MAG: hypothetical protein AAFY78_11660 [Cyanobacteria bacterium J06648_16]
MRKAPLSPVIDWIWSWDLELGWIRVSIDLVEENTIGATRWNGIVAEIAPFPKDGWQTVASKL